MSAPDPRLELLKALIKPEEAVPPSTLNEPARMTQRSNGSMTFDGIRYFFEECDFDVYSKENRGPESFRITGEPCHGGYEHKALGRSAGEDQN